MSVVIDGIIYILEMQKPTELTEKFRANMFSVLCHAKSVKKLP